MCLTNPITISGGANGASVTIAFASDSSGTGFSYTADASRPYISFVSKAGTVTESDFTTWVKYIGADGTNGTDGNGIQNVYVSDGSTAIGGTVYTVNTLVLFMDDGTYINAGVIDFTPNWTSIPNLNNWTVSSDAAYAIVNGFIYFRGTVTSDGTTSSIVFLNLSAGFTGTVNATISKNSVATEVSVESLFVIDGTASTVSISHGTTSTGIYMLDTVGPISIR